jgi:8-oxo-dGTP diphosphatase
MTLFLVRHAKAGEKSTWVGDDARRPLSKSGRRQAEALADRLAGEDVTALISSPALRCVDTLVPLADRMGLTVEVDDRLAEGSSLADALAALATAPDRAVLCSHGDVVTELVSALGRRGMELTSAPDWRKATLWVLECGEQGDEPAFKRAWVEPPPQA